MRTYDFNISKASEPIDAFIERWGGVTASELSTAQSFVIDLCGLLGLDKPHATAEQDDMFERPITFHHGDGTTSAGRIDCYKRGHFVLEAKKWRAADETQGLVRWLRPDYQHPSPAAEQGELDVDSEDTAHSPQVVVTARTTATWAADLPAQIKAVAEVLQSNPGALSEDSIAAHFKGKGRWRERLPTILASLEALGRAQQTDADLWRGL